MSSKGNLLILGLGNTIMGDEGVGVAIVEELKKGPLPEGVEMLDGGTMGMALTYKLAAYKRVLVVDAVKGEGIPDLEFYTLENLVGEGDGDGLSLHGLGFVSVIKLMDALKMEVPEISILGVRVERLEPGTNLSERCRGLLPKAVRMVLSRVNGVEEGTK